MPTVTTQDQELLAHADNGIRSYLDAERAQGRIAGNYFEDALARTVPNLRRWLGGDHRVRSSITCSTTDSNQAGQ